MARQPKDVTAEEQPDVEAWVWAAVDMLNGASGPQHRTANFSLDWSPDVHGWIRSEGVQIDTRGPSKVAVKKAAWAAMRAVLALEGVTHADGVCTQVRVVSGPLWLPEPDGEPRYVTRVAVVAHPLTEPTGS